MKPSWIQCVRQSSSRADITLSVRIRADFVTMVMETLTKAGDKYKPGVRIHLGNNNHVDVVEDTMESVCNKISVAMGSGMTLITEPSPDYAGHPDFGRKEAA